MQKGNPSSFGASLPADRQSVLAGSVVAAMIDMGLLLIRTPQKWWHVIVTDSGQLTTRSVQLLSHSPKSGVEGGVRIRK